MSTPYNKKAIRTLLERHPDGLTVTEISEKTGIVVSSAYVALKRDERTYVDRWTNSQATGQWAAVWCLAPPLVDAPMPTIKASEYLRAMKACDV